MSPRRWIRAWCMGALVVAGCGGRGGRDDAQGGGEPGPDAATEAATDGPRAGDAGGDGALDDAGDGGSLDGGGDAPVDPGVDVPLDGGGDGAADGGGGEVGSEGGADKSTDAVEAPPYVGPVFTEVSTPAGVSYLQGSTTICATLGLCGPQSYFTGGAAVGDYDRDGHADLFVTRADAPPLLFRNLGGGSFVDATGGSGIFVDKFSNAGAWLDIDNDGDEDLYVTSHGTKRYHLFVNDGAGKFTEEALARGAAIESESFHIGNGVGVGDYDRDGWLDLFVTEWRHEEDYPGEPSNARLLHNLGAGKPGHFEDLTAAAGVETRLPTGDHFSFGAAFSDLDSDGFLDLAIVSDFGASRLFWNAGDGTFLDGTVAAGVGTDDNGMGSSIGDFDLDGRLDWFVTAIMKPAVPTGGNRLYRNDGGRKFSDHTDAVGVRSSGWSWGTAMFDYDNDGDLDFVVVNGMPHMERWRTDPTRFWRNEGGLATTEVAGAVGLTDTREGTGLVVFDYDEDGDLDLFIVNWSSTPFLYRNDGGSANDWLRVRLEDPIENPLGLGARVTVKVTATSPPLVREIGTTTFFQGQSEDVAHFGLGKGADPVAEVRVVWPRTRKEQIFTKVARRSTLVVEAPP